MNVVELLPLISKALGRDLTPEAQLFFRARAAIGAALPDEDKELFAKNWRQVVDYMESAEGKKSIKTFINHWKKAVTPPESKPAE